jgi:alpha-tubulin suppressor-like RCC1 family protein
VRISGSRGFLFILPDGTLWRWGQDQIISPPRQTGTNRDWVQASVVNFSAVGLRSDGSLWAWAFDNNEPSRLGSSHDWADVCAGNGASIALKRDGTLWTLTENPVNHSNNRPAPIRRDVAQVGTNRDWKAISATLFGGSRVALRADGTLWTWGNVNYVAYGRWFSTNIAAPTQLCRESNWVGFCDGLGGGAQNQAGELWSLFPLAGLPGEGVPVAAICSRASSNATSSAGGLLFRADWTPASFETHSDGTLWATPLSWSTMYAPIATPLRVGQRSDWVSVWGTFNTTIGLTSDGTLWTWGKDYGQPAHYEFGDRFGMLKEMIATLLGAAPPSSIYAVHDECGQYYPEKEPRPLLRIVTPNAAEANPQR